MPSTAINLWDACREATDDLCFNSYGIQLRDIVVREMIRYKMKPEALLSLHVSLPSAFSVKELDEPVARASKPLGYDIIFKEWPHQMSTERCRERKLIIEKLVPYFRTYELCTSL